MFHSRRSIVIIDSGEHFLEKLRRELHFPSFTVLWQHLVGYREGNGIEHKHVVDKGPTIIETFIAPAKKQEVYLMTT